MKRIIIWTVTFGCFMTGKGQAQNSLMNDSSVRQYIMGDYSNDFFSNRHPWYLAYAQYGRKTNFGPVIGRVNYAHRFDITDWQLEADAYPRLTKTGYFYANAGYSAAKLFPEYRFGAEYFQALPRSFEVSLGIRYLIFKPSDVLVYTGSVSKYLGNFLFCIRPYIIPREDGISYTLVFQLRKYVGSDVENYFDVQYFYGNSPDDIHASLTGTNVFKLKANKIRAAFSHRIIRFWSGSVVGAFEREEYNTSRYFNKYSIEFSLVHFF